MKIAVEVFTGQDHDAALLHQSRPMLRAHNQFAGLGVER